MKRLNVGCGYQVADGWYNIDSKNYEGHIIADLRDGLPFDPHFFDYAVAHHTLQMLTYMEIEPGLSDILRVLKPGGVLRISEPDIEEAIYAWQRQDSDWFPIEGEHSRDGKFLAYITWYSEARLIFTADWMQELCLRAGFSNVDRVGYRDTISGWPEIVELDSRERESFYLEATK